MIVNPELDLERLASLYRENGYVFVKDFLQTDVAENLLRVLASLEDWSLHIIGEQSDHTSRELGEMSSEEIRALSPAPPSNYLNPNNSLGVYERYLILENIREGGCPKELADYLEAVNSTQYKDTLRKITAVDSEISISADAGRYRSGHFLSAHTDTKAGEKSLKLVAHVLNLAKDWESSYGGELIFCNNWGQIEIREKPQFNCLGLFRVPRRHYVQAVTDHAPFPRHSLYGWLLRRSS